MTTEFQPNTVLSVYTTFAWVQPTGSGSGDLSRSQANALYLQKTVPDTATALQTFDAGIVTVAPASLLDNSTRVPTTAWIVSQAFLTVASLVGYATYAGTTAFTALQTFNLGIKTNEITTITGNLSLPASTTTAPASLLDNSTRVPTTAWIVSQAFLTVASLVGYATYAGTTAFTALQTFNLGIKTNIINAFSASADMTIGSNLSTGKVIIGSQQSDLNIKATPASYGTINMFTGSLSAGTINIGGYSSSPAVIYTTTTINGEVNIGNTDTQTNIYGTITLDGNTTINGNVDIGSSGATTTVTITGNETVTGTLNTNTINSISTNPLTIGNTSINQYIRGASVNINDTTGNTTLGSGGGNTTIGSGGGNNTIGYLSGNTSIGGGTFTINIPITIGYTTAPSSDKIGYIISASIPSALNITTNTSVTSLTLPVGTWLISAQPNITPTSATFSTMYVKLGTTNIQEVNQYIVTKGTLNAVFPYYNSTSATLEIVLTTNFLSKTGTGGFLKVVRLA